MQKQDICCIKCGKFLLTEQKDDQNRIGVLLVVMKMDTMMNVRTSFSVWNVQKKKDTKYRIVLMAYGKI